MTDHPWKPREIIVNTAVKDDPIAQYFLHRCPGIPVQYVSSNTDAFRDRVTVLRTIPPKIEELVPWLKSICTTEKIIIKDNNALTQVARSGGRLPRESLSLLDKVAVLEEPLTTSLVKELAQDLHDNHGYTAVD